MDELERRPALMKLKLQLIIESDSGQTGVIAESVPKRTLSGIERFKAIAAQKRLRNLNIETFR